MKFNQQRGVGVHYNLKRFIPNFRMQTGQGMIEFSMILAVMIGLFVGAFEIMTLFRKRTDLEAGTRLGARQASESWVTDGLTDESFEAQIKDYVYDEMERMTYDRNWMEGPTLGTDDDRVRVLVEAYEFDQSITTPGDETLIPSGGKICTYGEYIKVTVEMDWTFAVLPINTLLPGDTLENGTMSQELLLRCWRGN
ncbi:MAG: TadE/TadG family type IV pilus assembly protein [Anaerolineae bacterium]